MLRRPVVNAGIPATSANLRGFMRRVRFKLIALLVAGAMPNAASAQATGTSPAPSARAPIVGRLDTRDAERRAFIEHSLKHIYAIYLGLRSCSEIGAMQNDRSFLPEVSLDEARQYLRGVDAATREIGIDPAQVWNAEAPLGLITAEALKTNPETHLKFCQRMGSLFRVDAGNLQAALSQMGAKSPIITKDY